MQENRNNNRFSLGWLIAIGIGLFTAGGATAWLTFNRLSSVPTTVETPVSEPSPLITTSPVASPVPEQTLSPSPVATPIATEVVQVYWLKLTDTQTQLVAEPLEVKKQDNKGGELKQAFTRLLKGSENPAYTSLLPSGTKLLGLESDKTGIKINFSQEFASDGGTEALIARMAQVIYTATSLDPKANVWISVEGQPLDLLGESHGLMIDQPMTRKSFEENFQLSGN
jgi:spore germination protein GerM